MTRRKLAKSLAGSAYAAQQLGELDRAARLYRASLRVAPTPEAWTGLGNIYGLRGDLHRAIAFCRRAIGLDPEFGTAYGAIGSYLIELHEYPAAITWLRRALKARRHRGFAAIFVMIGRMHECLGEELKALRAYALALRVAPHSAMAGAAIERLIIKRN